MKRIKELCELIEEEICGAKTYAEKYLELKASGESTNASKFKNMANDELSHATTVHEYAISEIDKLRNVYTPPVEMQDEWDKTHAKYVEKVAFVKYMLSM